MVIIIIIIIIIIILSIRVTAWTLFVQQEYCVRLWHLLKLLNFYCCWPQPKCCLLCQTKCSSS